MSTLNQLLVQKKLEKNLEAIAQRDSDAEAVQEKICEAISFLSNFDTKFDNARVLFEVSVEENDAKLMKAAEENLDALLEIANSEKVVNIFEAFAKISKAKTSSAKEEALKSLGLD